jgi:zinc/manganese transport system permease protein
MLLDLWFFAPILALTAGVLALAPLGVQVLRRGVVFIDLAVAQAAAAAAMAAFADHPTWLVTQLIAAGGALLAAGVVALLSRAWPEYREALIGLVYISCACGALLIARHDAHGSEHLQSLLAADILWSSWTQVAVLSACAVAVMGLSTMGYLSRDSWFFVCFAVVARACHQSMSDLIA